MFHFQHFNGRARLLFCLFALWTVPAQAAVTITFYSHDFRMFAGGLTSNFPHGFITLSGTPDAGGPAVSGNFGFSATNFFINALWQPVEGGFDETPLAASYMRGATRHFAFPLSDAQYRAVMAVVEKWKTWPQPSYDIDKHNCVTFVKEMAIAAGLSVSSSPAFIHHPKEFLADTAMRNADFLDKYDNAAQVSTPGDGLETLRNRTRQLENQVRALKARN